MIKTRVLGSTDYPIPFLMVSSGDHVTAQTGLSPTVLLSKNGAAFAACAGAVSEIGYGWYALAGNATDRNTLGELLIHASAAGADPSDLDYYIVESLDDLDNLVPGDYASGTAGAALGRIGSAMITTVMPVSMAGNVETYQGDDYSAAHARALEWTDVGGLWPTITGATIEVLIGNCLTGTGSVINGAGANKKVQLELNKDQTEIIKTGNHHFQIVATLVDGDVVTLLEGRWVSIKKLEG